MYCTHCAAVWLLSTCYAEVDSAESDKPRLYRQGILDFCNQPSFIRNVYLNLDCRLERGDLFENIAGLLSKTAFPVNTALGSVHLLSLEGLFSILSGLSTGCASDADHSIALRAVQSILDPGHCYHSCTTRCPYPRQVLLL